jgi:hypothetical protein
MRTAFQGLYFLQQQNNTQVLAKLAEKLVYEDIKGFIEALGIIIIPTSQHGFQDKKSVTSLLFENTDQQWTQAINNRKMIDTR